MPHRSLRSREPAVQMALGAAQHAAHTIGQVRRFAHGAFRPSRTPAGPETSPDPRRPAGGGIRRRLQIPQRLPPQGMLLPLR
eukprot:2912392-Pyramimonas_sp.AAC.1